MKEILLILLALFIYDVLKAILLWAADDKKSKPKREGLTYPPPGQPPVKKSKFQTRLDIVIEEQNKKK